MRVSSLAENVQTKLKIVQLLNWRRLFLRVKSLAETMVDAGSNDSPVDE